MATTRNEREALGIDYVTYRIAGEKADRALAQYLRGQYVERQPKGYENRHARRAKAARLRRLRKRHPTEDAQALMKVGNGRSRGVNHAVEQYRVSPVP